MAALAAGGQIEFKLRGMQELVRDKLRLSAVNPVPNSWEADGSHMDANLVRAPGFYFSFHEGKIFKTLHNAVAGDSRFGVWV